MKKPKKILWGVVITLVVLVMVGVIVASAFLGNIVKKGVETVGPQITQVSIKLDDVHLSLWAGSATIKGLVVGNPEGYQTPQAISAGMIAVGVNPLSVLSDKIVLRSLDIESPEITFEGGLSGNNLSKILDNVNASAHAAAQTSTVSTNATVQAKPSKKFELDDLLITGAQVHVSLTELGGKEMTLSLPPIHLTNLGKNKDGITAADLTRNILDAIVTATVKAVSDAGAHLGKNAEGLIKNAGKSAGAGVNNITKGLGNLLGK
ncbi:MAG: AsmA family protein [Verrucomicrobiia bacterium]